MQLPDFSDPAASTLECGTTAPPGLLRFLNKLERAARAQALQVQAHTAKGEELSAGRRRLQMYALIEACHLAAKEGIASMEWADAVETVCRDIAR